MGPPEPSGLKACWQEPKLSDITVRIIERPMPSLCKNSEEPGVKADATSGRHEVKYDIPCSKAVLAAHSEYFRGRLLSDLEHGATEFPLFVEEGEADAGLAVVKIMYTGLLEDVTAAELVTMWKIADRLQATSAALCVKALCAMDLDWDTCMMVRSDFSRTSQSGNHVGC